MKALFVYSLDDIQSIQKPLRSWATIQFGISYISSLLSANGHQTRLLVLGDNRWNEGQGILDAALEDFDPGLVCLTATYSQYSFIERIAASIKEKSPGRYLLIGGVHASLNPDQVIRGPFDALCLGEGEYPTLELCDQIDKHQSPAEIPNLWIKSPDGQIERNPPRNYLTELDQLPFPDRAIWEPWMKTQLDAEYAVLIGRGCPYNCTYCSNHALRKIAPGRYVRFRSPENIVEEIRFLHQTYQAQRIYLEVETIAANKPWAIELCDQLEAFNAELSEPLTFACNFRISPNAVDEALFNAFQRANFDRINVGLESGSEKIRREVLKRIYSNQDFLEVVALARRHKLSVFTYNMIGLPDESLADHQETVDLNRKVQPAQHYTGIFFPYPGTELYDLCIEKGYLAGPVASQMERRRPIIDLPAFSKRQIQRAYTWFDFRVYRGHKPLWVLITRALVTKVRSNPTTNYIFRLIVQLPILRNIRARVART